MFRFLHRNKPPLISFLLSPPSAILVISLIILAFQILFIGKLRPFNSDDLYWQQVVRTWTPFSGKTLYLGTKDIFIEQVPFFAFMEHFFPASRKLLILETYLLTAAAFMATFVTAIYFLKKLKTKATYFNLLPFVWLASFGYPLVQNYLNSSWRTFEVGLSMLTFLLIAAFLFHDFNPRGKLGNRVLAVFSIIFSGILIYSDPYYTYFTVVPILLLTGGLFLGRRINRNQLMIIYGAVFLSFLLAKATELLFRAAGVKIVADTPSIFINFEQILQNAVTAVHGFLIIYGADFFGRPIMGKDTVIAGINALLVFVISLTVFFQLRHRTSLFRKPNRDLLMVWPYFFAALIVFVFLIYGVSTLVTVGNFRFFIISVYASIILLTLTIGLITHKPTQQILGALLILATIGNVGFVAFTNTIRTQPDIKNNISNSLNYTIINSLKARGIPKGYASYWHGNVNTYLSNSQVVSLPSLCTPEGKTNRYLWLVDGAQFHVSAKRSFYLIDPEIPDPPLCSKEQLIAQFGVPTEIYMIQDKTILVFDYDITSRMAN